MCLFELISRFSEVPMLRTFCRLFPILYLRESSDFFPQDLVHNVNYTQKKISEL